MLLYMYNAISESQDMWVLIGCMAKISCSHQVNKPLLSSKNGQTTLVFKNNNNIKFRFMQYA